MANAIFWAFVAFLFVAMPWAVRSARRRAAARLVVVTAGGELRRESQYHPAMASTGPNPDSRTQQATPASETGTVPAAGVAPARAHVDDLAATPEMRHQSAYVWLIFFSSLDIMLTWAILRRGGEEVNPVARQVIAMWGLHGAIVFKFALMLFVIVSCEVVSRKREHVGRRLAWVAVGIAAFPVVYSFGLLIDHILLRPPPVG